MAESLQIFALSRGAVSKAVLSALDLDAGALRQWKAHFCMARELRHHERVSYAVLDLIAAFAPQPGRPHRLFGIAAAVFLGKCAPEH